MGGILFVTSVAAGLQVREKLQEAAAKG